MTITALQAKVSPALAQEPGAPKQGGAAGSPFETVLDALAHQQGGAPARPQLAAAELFRIGMMQNSLSLCGPAEAGAPSQLALESLLSWLGANPSHLGPTERSGMAGTPSRAPNAGEPEPAGHAAHDRELAGIGETAAHFLGTPYRFGGEGPEGIDCSSFVQQVFQEHRIDLPRTAREQMKQGQDVAAGELKQGDLVFFQTYASYPSHVGIYLGDGKMIHASSGKGEVTISDMNSDYYRSRYLGARRVA